MAVALKELARPKKKKFTYDNEGTIRRYRETGDEDLREEFFTQNVKLCRHIVGKFTNTGLPEDDLLAEAYHGLFKAFNSFNVDKGIKFATYSARCITNEILMHVRKTKRYRMNYKNLEHTIKTDADGHELTLLDITASDSSFDYEKREQLEIARQVLALAREQLKPLELRCYLNTLQDSPLTQLELSHIEGLSQSYISRVEQRAIKRVCKLARLAGLLHEDEYNGKGKFKAAKKVKRQKPAPQEVEQLPTKVYNMYDLQKGAGNPMGKQGASKVERLQSDKAKQVVYYYLHHPEMSQKAVAEICGISQPYTSTTYRRLKVLSEEELTSLSYITPEGVECAQDIPEPPARRVDFELPKIEDKPQTTEDVKDADLQELRTAWEKEMDTSKAAVVLPQTVSRKAPKKVEINMDGATVRMVDNIIEHIKLDDSKTYNFYISIVENE